MSRIAGLFVPPGAEPPMALLAPVADRLGERPDWVRRVLRCPGGVLCRTGADDGGAAAWDGVTAVVDGVFANADDLAADLGLPAGTDEARLVAALHRRFGFTGALERINGDFAVALADAAAGALWLGRDRIGVRPLYHAALPGGGVAFASRPGALLALPGVPGTVNAAFAARVAGLHYRCIDNAPEDSPFEGVAQLPAATALRVTEGGTSTRVYWRLADDPDHEADAPELAERFRDLLLDAVARRVRRAGRPAFTLSGGLDSSSVVACALRVLDGPAEAFSSVYSDPTYDERAEIASMVAAGGVRWTPVPVEGVDVFETVARMLAAHDEPVATATWLSHHRLCEAVAGSGATTLFGGLGGDELHAGEYEYFPFHFADLRAAGRINELEHEIACWARHHDHPVFRKDRAVAESMLARLTDPAAPGRVRPDRDRLARYRTAVRREWVDLAAFEPVMEHPFASALKNRAYQDMTRETAPCCLRAQDRHAAAFGLAVVNPFFDHRLVEFMFRVPGTLKIRDGVTKRLLRESMRGVLPEETRARVKKTGWNAPAHLWFAEGRSGAMLADLAASRRFRERGLYDPAVVDRLLAEHRAAVASGRPVENHMMFFWQLVNVELWFERLSSLRGAGPAGPARSPVDGGSAEL